jgi:hypothetical protein
MTKVSSWNVWISGGLVELRDSVEDRVTRVVEEESPASDEGNMTLDATEGQRSFIRGRKLFSFCDRDGSTSMSIERRERRRYGDGDEIWDGMDLTM